LSTPVWPGPPGGLKALITRFFDRRLVVMVLCGLAVLALLSPFTFLDFVALYLTGGNLNAARNVKLAFLEPLQTWTLAYHGLTPFVYELTTLLLFGMGGLSLAICLIGTLLALRRFGTGDKLLLAFVVPFFLVIGLSRVRTIRYILPLIPFLTIAGAVCLDALAQWARARRVSWLYAATATVAAGASLFYAVAFARLYGETDSRWQASEWLYQHAPRGAAIVVEDEFTYVPPLGVPDDQIDPWNRAVVDPTYPMEHRHDVRVLFSPYYTAYETADPTLKAAHIHDTLAGADYIVVSERHYQPYARLPDIRPVEYQYYQDLFDGKLGFRLAAVFDPSPNLFGLALNDDRAELYSKVFDHPKIWIFEQIR
jgi:hypothetical protein